MTIQPSSEARFENIDFLVAVDEEGIDLRNLSCDQMGIRDLLRSARAPQVAQALARPIGFAALSDKRGYFAVTNGDEFEQQTIQYELNEGWRLIEAEDAWSDAMREITTRVEQGQPVLVSPVELNLSYYPPDAPRGHLAILGSIRDGVARIYDDLEVLELRGAPVEASWSEVAGGRDSNVHWYRIEPTRVTRPWLETLASILEDSIESWTSSAGSHLGLAGLRSLIEWLDAWDFDPSFDTEQLTSLFLSMRFEMCAGHHLLEIAIRRTSGLENGNRLADCLCQTWRRWNSVIALLVGWKALGGRPAGGIETSQFDRLYASEERVVDEMADVRRLMR